MDPTRLFVAWYPGAARAATVVWVVPSQAVRTSKDLISLMEHLKKQK